MIIDINNQISILNRVKKQTLQVFETEEICDSIIILKKKEIEKGQSCGELV